MGSIFYWWVLQEQVGSRGMVKLPVFRMSHLQEPSVFLLCIQQSHSSPFPCPSSPTLSFHPIAAQKLKGNSECEGSEGTQKWAEQLQPSQVPQAWVTAPGNGTKRNLPFEGAVAAHRNPCKNMTMPANHQISLSLLLGSGYLLVGYIFQKLFIMRQHGKFSLVNLIKLDTNKYVML